VTTASNLTQEVDPLLLEQAASTALAEALALLSSPSAPGVRERHRELLERSVDLAQRALVAASGQANAARWTLLRAHTARAENARYGAGQLARGSQRAPTHEDCDDGWQRVEAIVRESEASALATAAIADELDHPQARELAQRAQASATKARQIVQDRNPAYTFHADPRFSFGEGWYLAAAAVLTGVPIQIEPDQPQTAQATTFLEEAGLAPLLTPYRPRPPANKALPDLVARAFRRDPKAAQAQLRAAFLGEGPVPEEIRAWIDQRIAPGQAGKKVLAWVRYGTHHPDRNTDRAELELLCELLLARGLVPVLVGDALRGGAAPAGSIDLTLFWKDPLFQGARMRRAQLQFFECLRQSHGLVGQLGVTTAGMDGPALMGLPAMYLTQKPNVRLGKWVGAVPGYEEIVRTPDYLQRIARTLARWQSGG
jgi:hypothetical protein